MPWDRSELAGWSIIGMNHYSLNGERRLFVAMVRERDFVGIRAEGPDEVKVFEEIARKAFELEVASG